MSTTVLESDSSTTTINLTDGGVAVAISSVIDTVDGNNKPEPTKISSEAKKVDNHCSSSDIGPLSKKPKSRPTPYSKPILLTADRRQRKNKSITWRPDDSLRKIHYFEKIPDERINVYKLNVQPQTEAANASSQNAAVSSPNAHANRLNPLKSDAVQVVDSRQSGHALSSTQGHKSVHAPIRLAEWKLILIDFTPALPSPGWNSVERSAQAERETYVLGAIDLPGQPSTIDEPDNATGSEPTHSNEVKTIPLENPDELYTEYPDMYNSEIVNGIRITNGSFPPVVPNVAVFNGQSSQLLPDQYQQQLINVVQNPFTFQEMSAQFQQQQPQPFPFATQQQQQQPQPFQTHFIAQQQQQQPQQIVQPGPFMNQHPQPQPQQIQQSQPQHQQQPGVPGPITPWLNYPFNPVSENSHALLFRRPAT